MPVPTKAEQAAESEARQKAGVVSGDQAAALDVIEDTVGGEGGSPQPQTTQTGDPPAPQAPAKTPFDIRRTQREEIVARFRADREQQAADQADDISEFTRSGMPPEFAENNAPVVEQVADAVVEQGADVTAQPGQIPAAGELPKTVKVVVRGQEMELPLDEVIAKAQMTLAADTYLDEAKTRLKSVEDLERDIRARAPRGAQTGVHPAGQDGVHPANQTAQPTELQDANTADGSQHPEDQIDKLFETIQFGDPQEGRTLLRDVIQSESGRAAKTAVSEILSQNALKDEGARSAKVIKEFADKHPEIAKDGMARAAISSDVVDQQLEDIKLLGVDPMRLRPDGLPPTASDITVAHRYYRAEGFKVKSPSDMLEASIKKFITWKGGGTATTTTPQTVDPANKAPARVDLSIDRSVRRTTIPQQPSRAIVTPAAEQARAPAPKDRSTIVAEMMAKRAAPRGRVLG